MLPGGLPLPKGASLADVSMHVAGASAAPPSLIDVRHMYARGGVANGHFGHITKKQRRKPRLAPSDEYVRHRFGAGASVLTDHDGAVLLMVLAGLYDH